MTTVVQRNNIAAIPPQLAAALGIKEGTRLEWTDAGSGTILVKPVASRGERARALMGAGHRWLKPGDDPIGDLLKDRIAEDAHE
jgi:bifunctional DNA-binding transcriptional regulator/antitoxin component of YhaV-PrlF toxin-antitoxin module